jgi:hypothetical protein
LPLDHIPLRAWARLVMQMLIAVGSGGRERAAERQRA